jgi:hypothetical protein
VCVELDQARARRLERIGFATVVGDFLELDPRTLSADVALMNPPFENGQDLRHVLQALACAPRAVALLPGGSLDGVDRHTYLWSQHTLDGQTTLVRRFKTPGTKHGAQRAYGVFDIRRGVCTSRRRAHEWWV